MSRKIARIAAGAKPRLMDLFAGCGGISLGFQRAGFEIRAAIEIDELAARSHAVNFFRGRDADAIEHHARARNITTSEPDQVAQDFDLGSPEDSIDVLVGGPHVRHMHVLGAPSCVKSRNTLKPSG